tara:strand:+ start:1504 stop:1968 length:465 start_codon:yes stop_codon:yes gene_type:complete
MFYFFPHRISLLLVIIIQAAMASCLKGEDYSNVIAKENIFNSKNILPIAEAFKLDVKIKENTILLKWKIDENCYLYRDKFKFTSGSKELNLNLPRGSEINDQFFGEMEVFYSSFDLKIDLGSLEDLEVVYQGCHKKGYCYTPVKKSIKISSLKK